MKNLYCCERCGKVFTDCIECEEHENHEHSYVPENGWYYTQAREAWNKEHDDEHQLGNYDIVRVYDVSYDEKHSAPKDMTLMLEKWIPVEKDSEGNDYYEPRILLHKYTLKA